LEARHEIELAGIDGAGVIHPGRLTHLSQYPIKTQLGADTVAIGTHMAANQKIIPRDENLDNLLDGFLAIHVRYFQYLRIQNFHLFLLDSSRSKKTDYLR